MVKYNIYIYNISHLDRNSETSGPAQRDQNSKGSCHRCVPSGQCLDSLATVVLSCGAP